MKQILTFFLLFLLAFNSLGQSRIIGIKAGISKNNIRMNYLNPNNSFNKGIDYKTKSLDGFVFGLSYDYIKLNKFTYGAELLFERKGFSEEIIFTDVNGTSYLTKDIKYKYDFISLPIKIGYISTKKLFVVANIGFIPAIFSKCQTVFPLIKMQNSEPVYVGDTTFNNNSVVSTFDIAAMAELGGGYKLTEKISINALYRYQHSFSSFYRGSYFLDPGNYFSGVVSFGLKYRLKGK